VPKNHYTGAQEHTSTPCHKARPVWLCQQRLSTQWLQAKWPEEIIGSSYGPKKKNTEATTAPVIHSQDHIEIRSQTDRELSIGHSDNLGKIAPAEGLKESIGFHPTFGSRKKRSNNCVKKKKI